MAQNGTLTLLDLLDERFQSVAAFGLNTVAEVVARDLAAYNAITADMFSDLAEVTDHRQRVAGGSDVGAMVDVDEFGTAPTQKTGTGQTVGFPLRLVQYNLGWTRKWMQIHTVAEMAEQVQNAQKAHQKRMIRDMKRAMFYATNETFRDRLAVPVLDLSVRRFVNADSQPIPDGPFGETYTASSHQHYTAAASLAVADLTTMINNVREHGHGDDLIVAINVANETAVKALTGFSAFNFPLVIPSDSSARTNVTLNNGIMNNRPIGVLSGATVWVKPWAIANYAVCYDRADSRKPLCLRTRDGKAPALVVASEFEAYPLHAQYMESEFGFGVWTRTNGAVHKFDAGSYSDPTIA